MSGRLRIANCGLRISDCASRRFSPQFAIRNPQSAMRPAAVLILVLWAMVILSLVAGGISFAIRQDTALANIDRDRLIAHWSARAGVERAIAAVMDDWAISDVETDLWSDDEIAFKEVEVGDGSFSVIHDRYEPAPLAWFGANDESAKLNVNIATREQLMKLPKMTAPVAAAILDWRDNDQSPQSDGIEGGYYGNLAHPYRIRNAPLKTIRELLLVRGVTPDLFYGEDANVNGRLDANEDDADANEPPDNADGRLDRGWYAYLTVYTFEKNEDGTGLKRLNLKTADAGSLAVQLQLEDWAAESIVKHRDSHEFNHLVDLLEVQIDSSVVRGSTSEDSYSRGDDEKNQPVTKAIFQRIVDQLTLSNDEMLPGRVNINTAPIEVLKTLMDDDITQAVKRFRDRGDEFTSIADLLDISGMTTEKFGNLENFVTVRSSVFRILSLGQAASELARETIECVVDRSGKTPRVLYWSETSP